MTHSALRLLVALPVTAIALAGCSNDTATTATDRAGAISIVASTNVYGDIAKAIAGSHVHVTSFIASSSQDPHEYEASAQDRLALDKSDIVIENGGGYDPFMHTLLDTAHTDAVVIDAVEVSGLAPAGEHDDRHKAGEGHDHIEGFNEHIWYDFPAVDKVAEELSKQLSDLDSKHASTYRKNYEAFTRQIEKLENSAEELKATSKGRAVAITEPVPLYLLGEVGLVNHTPTEFSEAVEEGADVPPRVLQETLDLFTADHIAVLAYNPQTSDKTTEKLRHAAKAAGVPVVDFTETLPRGQSYLQWQRANLDHLASALGRG